ncbi:enterobactin esterase [Paenibacillus pectinilyticus]|uniref:Enterobactin esterase n=1 Tax=Paenibacillus pectinilyticus TaxID=512399 RepID=A0A1C0ZTX0_9BACL|nr:alpha/beta hydrolase [Paenibacillus pectinilyticus]OCT11521.1 enterobactin esterase [Paenibacillus pectinilyticus]
MTRVPHQPVETPSEAVVHQAFTLPNTEQYLLHTAARKQPYQIYVSKPAQEAPPQGFPVIYLLDANALFATMVETLRVQSRVPEKTGVYPTVVVGIGYPTEEPFDSSRFYDFTMPTPQEVLDALPVRNKDAARPQVGGADAFRAFIEQELKPRIERDYPIDTKQQAIFGHSLGGLFVLQTLFTQPQTYQTYIAGSPSVHWNKVILREQEEQYTSNLQQANHKLLITIAEQEKNHPSNMSENAIELYERLALLPREKLQADFYEFEGEGHISVLPALVSRAVRFLRRG